MLDIKFIRENKGLIENAAKKKGVDFEVEKLLEIDDKRKEILSMVEEKRAEQNQVSDEIARVGDNDKKQSLIEKMKVFKESLRQGEEKLRAVMEDWRRLMLEVPNIPDMSVPEGKSEDENITVKTWGEKPVFDFDARSHMDVMTDLQMVDFERGVKVHGFRGYFLKNDGALLSWAIWNYARDFFLGKGFTPFLPPSLVKKEYFYGTGHLPSEAEDLFKTQDDDFLSGTSEVAMMAYHADEVLSKDELPKKYLAFSPCYRREAGSHGKDTKGLVRVHEFYKWEQLVLCEASHEQSVKFHEEMNRNTEEFMESLKIPYRQLTICTGDLTASKVKQYDTELWVPGENKYREIGSASYYHDFQTRRFNIRYSDEQGKKYYAHSLNATAAPTPRILVAIVENFQQADGSVVIPEVLRPYMAGKEKISK